MKHTKIYENKKNISLTTTQLRKLKHEYYQRKGRKPAVVRGREFMILYKRVV